MTKRFREELKKLENLGSDEQEERINQPDYHNQEPKRLSAPIRREEVEQDQCECGRMKDTDDRYCYNTERCSASFVSKFLIEHLKRGMSHSERKDVYKDAIETWREHVRQFKAKSKN